MEFDHDLSSEDKKKHVFNSMLDQFTREGRVSRWTISISDNFLIIQSSNPFSRLLHVLMCSSVLLFSLI